MTVVEQDVILRETLHQAIDELPEESLSELSSLVAYLRYKQEHDMDWLYRLQKRFAPVQEAAEQLSEEAVNQAIDDAIPAVRRERKT
jgi:hypothetical protein